MGYNVLGYNVLGYNVLGWCLESIGGRIVVNTSNTRGARGARGAESATRIFCGRRGRGIGGERFLSFPNKRRSPCDSIFNTIVVVKIVRLFIQYSGPYASYILWCFQRKSNSNVVLL